MKLKAAVSLMFERITELRRAGG